MDFEPLEQTVLDYNLYREPGLDLTRVTLSDILPKIEGLYKKKDVSVVQAGTSIEGREIFRIKIGTGPVKVLLWSQMHGDESTATKAIFDLINFLSSGVNNSSLRNNLLNSLEIHFIPMLNPDGAEKFTRENSINVDLNRDAKSLQCPESQLLQKIKDEIKPEFCFNLHDQERYYSVAKTELPPALSFLAPPIDYEKTINDARRKGMQVIVYLNDVLDKLIPGRIAKYSDDHEPRSFGDNFNRQGSSVILIESGFLPGDNNKQKIREYNFIALLHAFYSIASGCYATMEIDRYNEIPENENRVFDLLVKNVLIKRGENNFKVDIGVNRLSAFDTGVGEFYSKGIIKGVGDLSTFTAHEIIDCPGLSASEGVIYAVPFESIDNIIKLSPEHLYLNGVTTIIFKEFLPMQEFINIPFNIALRNNIALHDIKPEMPANFYLSDQKGVKYLIVNGFLITFPFNKNLIRNSIIFR